GTRSEWPRKITAGSLKIGFSMGVATGNFGMLRWRIWRYIRQAEVMAGLRASFEPGASDGPQFVPIHSPTFAATVGRPSAPVHSVLGAGICRQCRVYKHYRRNSAIMKNGSGIAQ